MRFVRHQTPATHDNYIHEFLAQDHDHHHHHHHHHHAGCGCTTSMLRKVASLKCRQLFKAVKEGDLATVQTVLNGPPLSPAELGWADSEGWTCLMISSDNGEETLVKELLKAGAGTSLDTVNTSGYSALMLAARSGHEGVVRLLLDGGAKLDTMTADGLYNAHLLAELKGHEGICTQLINAPVRRMRRKREAAWKRRGLLVMLRDRAWRVHHQQQEQLVIQQQCEGQGPAQEDAVNESSAPNSDTIGGGADGSARDRPESDAVAPRA